MVDLLPSADPLVSVIVVSARDPERLARCLGAVAAGRGDVPIDVTVVLNAAQDGMEANLTRAVRGVRILSSDVPLGFAGGVNLGARGARGRFLGVLHDDAEPEPGWLEALVATMEADPRAGLAGSLITDLSTDEVQGAGHVLWGDASSQPPWEGPPPDAATFREVRDVDFASSASLLIRGEAWRAVGGMDEEIHPAQYVDADLAMAMRAAGWAVVVVPASRVRHARGGSSAWWRKVLAAQRNGEYFRRKWADDLALQAPRPSAAGGLPRAEAATAARASAVRSGPAPRTAARPAGAADGDDDAALRERRALLRDLAYKDAVVAEADRLLADHDARAEVLRARVTELETELARVVQGHGHEVAGRRSAEAELAAVRGTLDTILAGRVWRTRTAVRRLVARIPGRWSAGT
jgi:GT2 family glycosyltransferase